MTAKPIRKRRRPVSRVMLILVATPVLIATNLLGTAPDNPLSSGVRDAIAVVVPAEYKDYLDEFLSSYDLPTLSTATEMVPESTATPALQTATIIPPTITATPSPTPFPPTATPTMVVFEGKYCVDADALYVRTGPGIEYQIISYLLRNDCINVDGHAEGTNWFRISPNQPGYLDLGGLWIHGDYLLPEDYEGLPIVPVTPPLPH